MLGGKLTQRWGGGVNSLIIALYISYIMSAFIKHILRPLRFLYYNLSMLCTGRPICQDAFWVYRTLTDMIEYFFSVPAGRSTYRPAGMLKCILR